MQSRSRIALVAAVPVIALAAAGCGGSSKPTITAKAAASHSAPGHAKPSHSKRITSASSKHSSALAGSWSGQYSGAFNGTFKLTWTESNSKLSGKITLSDPAETTGIKGSVSGGTIRFGTVSGAVYNGTVSGNSMSGNYETPKGGGSWSATKG